MKQTAVVLLMVFAGVTQANAQKYVHVGCAGAESPIIQSAIHNNDVNHLDCGNTTPDEDYNGEGVGHEQTCGATYGNTQWASLTCNYGSASGCSASSLVYCAGSFVTATVHCPPSIGGPNAGKMPQASSNRFGSACSYHNAAGALVSKTCSCSDSSGCS